jgi:GntR family transcriptional regulator
MVSTPTIPRYIQIREALQEQIQAGHFEPGEKLPSEDQLAAEYSVSRMTMRRSLNELIDAGLIYRRHGLGTFVSNSTVRRDHTRLTDFFSHCRQGGHVPHVRVLCREIVTAVPHIAKALGLKSGAELLRLATLRSVDGYPVTYHDAYLPVALYPSLIAADVAALGLDRQHVWQLIEAQGFTLSNVVEQLEAQIANTDLATLLAIDPGAPILYGQRVLYADDGRPLKYADCYNRGDRFSLTVVLAR